MILHLKFHRFKQKGTFVATIVNPMYFTLLFFPYYNKFNLKFYKDKQKGTLLSPFDDILKMHHVSANQSPKEPSYSISVRFLTPAWDRSAPVSSSS